MLYDYSTKVIPAPSLRLIADTCCKDIKKIYKVERNWQKSGKWATICSNYIQNVNFIMFGYGGKDKYKTEMTSMCRAGW